MVCSVIENQQKVTPLMQWDYVGVATFILNLIEFSGDIFDISGSQLW